MHKQFIGVITLLGRLLITPIFAIAGYKHVLDFAHTQAGVGKGFQTIGIILPDWMLTVLAAVSCVLLVVGSISLVLGWQARFGALCLIMFLLGVTPTLHAFWAAPAEQYQMQLISFEKNVAIMGGLLFVMAFGPGPLSMDGTRAARRK